MRRSPIFLALLSCCAISTGQQCQQIKFSSGPSVAMRSAAVKSINAVMEAPATRAFSVSVMPPPGEEFADVFSVIVEPRSSKGLDRSAFCTPDREMPNCLSDAVSSGMTVSVYFRSSRGAERAMLLQKVRNYVDKSVLACPGSDAGPSLQSGLPSSLSVASSLSPP